jgi:hypothetical protein
MSVNFAHPELILKEDFAQSVIPGHHQAMLAQAINRSANLAAQDATRQEEAHRALNVVLVNIRQNMVKAWSHPA